MRLYIAAAYGRRLEMLGYHRRLQQAGYLVTSEWVFGLQEELIPDDHLCLAEHRGIAAQFARQDWENVRSADALITFTEPQDTCATRGGRHVEAGMALAWGKRIMVVGPIENIFYALPRIEVFSTFDACLQMLVHEQQPKIIRGDRRVQRHV